MQDISCSAMHCLQENTMSAMKRLFQLMAEKKASDIFMSVSSPINITDDVK